MAEIEQIIARFDPISLEEMDGVKLQDRVDTKYVLGTDQLPQVLVDLANERGGDDNITVVVVYAANHLE